MSNTQYLVEQFHSRRAPLDVKSISGPNYDQHIKKTILPLLHSHAKDLRPSQHGDPLEFLDPSLDTLPYLFSLAAQLQALGGSPKAIADTLKPGTQLFQKLEQFLTHFDPVEVRYAGQEWRLVVEVWAQIASDRANKKPEPILRVLGQAMIRLDPSAGTFTSTHLVFLRTCMEKRAYHEARLILDKDIHSFVGPVALTPVDSTLPCEVHQLSSGYITAKSGFTEKITLQDVQEYYLLGGMTYIGLKEWSRAAYYFEHVLSVPTSQTVNVLMLEAYKKWLLVLLLADRTTNNTNPELATSGVMKVLKNSTKAYETVFSAFKHTDARKLRAEVYEAQEVWAADGNLGLVNHVVEHHRQITVRKMAKVYISVPLSEVASTLDMSITQAVAYLDELISKGLLNAAMGSKAESNEPEVLRFMQQRKLDRSNEETYRELLGRKKRMEVLSEQVKGADRWLSLSREYLEHERRIRKNQEQQAAGAMAEEDPMDMSMPGGPLTDEDENVMAT